MDIGVERVSPFSPNTAREKKFEGNDKFHFVEYKKIK